MPTTTNFGWTTPADTDYVKDGALAIRTLGNGIDTSLVDLKGGTSGQYLVKNSNTDLDFTWTTNTADIDGITATSPLTGGGTSGTITVGIQDGTTAQKGAVQLEDSTSSTSTTKAATPNSVKSAYDLAGAAIAKSLIDAEGDLIVGDAADAVQRLAIGTTGQVLTVDTAVDGKIKWAAAGGGDLIKVGGGTFSASSAVNVNDVFSSTYKKYRIVIDYELAGATGRNLNLRWRVSGSDDSNSTYDYAYGYLNINGLGNATINYATAPANLSVIAYNNGTSNQANCRSAVSIDVHNPYDSGWTVYNGTSYSGDYQGAVNLIGGAFRNTTSFTGFSFYPAASTITGSYAVYGYTN